MNPCCVAYLTSNKNYTNPLWYKGKQCDAHVSLSSNSVYHTLF